MNSTISTLSDGDLERPPALLTQPANGFLHQFLHNALKGEGFIHWVELPADAHVDRPTLDLTNQRLRHYLQWMIGEPVLTVVHATPGQANALQGIGDTCLAVGTTTASSLAGHPSPLASGLGRARPLVLSTSKLDSVPVIMRTCASHPEHTLLILPQLDDQLRLFNPHHDLRRPGYAATPNGRPHGLIHRWLGASRTSRSPLPAPTDFERGLQLCSHLVQAFKEPDYP
ncbi:hypothetical protein [Pseudomonas sp.]|uniref:hypothetical protein n=1 Tax=Pseudomonas sp. TaxID=306 RepID=UPI0028B09936|nr:hypothetical protein [Pseudomonas sp.]